MSKNQIPASKSLLFVNKKKQKNFVNKSFLLLFCKKEDFFFLSVGREVTP